MRNFLAQLIITSIAAYITTWLLPGVELDGYLSAIILAALLGFLNGFVKPLLIILTIPFTLLTFGLFLIVINALIILIADYLMDGFHVNGFWQAFFFSFILTLIVSILENLLRPKTISED
jgi:putative membrane protein